MQLRKKMARTGFILLHLLAGVVLSSTALHCNFLSRLDEAVLYPEQGEYFDYDHRLHCAGAIAGWRYCYYTSDRTISDTYRVEIHVWRVLEYNILERVHTQSLPLGPSLVNNSFVCLKMEVNTPTQVEAGDFLGVELSQNTPPPIAVIGQGIEGSTLYLNAGNESQVILRRLDGVALHVDAIIVAPASSTTGTLLPVLRQYNTVTPSTTVKLSRTSLIATTTHHTFSTVISSPVASSQTISSSEFFTTSNRVPVTSSVVTSRESMESFQERTSLLHLTTSLAPSSTSLLLTSDITEIILRNTATPSSTSLLLASDKTEITLRNTATPSKLSGGVDSPAQWPFITGLIFAAVLLVLIVIVSILLILVARYRRDSKRFSADATKPDSVLITAFSQTRQSTRVKKEEIPTNMISDPKPPGRIMQLPPLSKPSTTSDESEQAADPNSVYDEPCIVSPTSNSSVCSIFSSECHQHTKAQPYETPLATPLSSRLNLFPSTSTLNTNVGSEVATSRSQPQPQLNPPCTMTLDRLRVVKAKKPLLPAKPAHLQLPGREAREKSPVPEKLPKPRAPTPEPADGAYDEGYCTVRHPVRLLQEVNIDTNIPSPQDMYCIPPDNEREIMDTLERMRILKIPRQDIQLISHIGTGEFGSVAKAYWKKKNREMDVAVKSIPTGHNDSEDRVKLLQEAVMMGQFRHPNVVQLHGIVTAGTSFMLVLEYLAKGDLRTHLLKMRQQTLLSSTNKLLTSYSQQVALGMHYLASKGFVHRDLAARNIFVSENNVCKVGDFGMSRDLANAPYYISRGGKIPVRWTAPEAMYYHKYSSATDVWSYGCVLYEIWSLGRLPFKRFRNTQVLERLESGYRLPPPPGTPRAIYELMMQTWHPNPHHRPEFRDILIQLVRDEGSLLHIPVSDASTSQQASQLGSPLTAGEYMYSDLQKAYLQQQIPAHNEEEYDSLIGQKYVLSFPTSSADIDYLYNGRNNVPQRSFRSHQMTSDTESEYEDLHGT